MNTQNIKVGKHDGGAICGGVISMSMHKANMQKDFWADVMAFVMPDKQYAKFIKLKKENKERDAEKIFNRYAISQI